MMTNNEIRETVRKMLETWDNLSPAAQAELLDVAAGQARKALEVGAPAAIAGQAWRICGGCSGTAQDVQHDGEASWGRCSDCGGVLGTFPTREAAIAQVCDLNELESAGDPALFFDVLIDGRRVHGWMDDQGRLAQIG